MTETNAGENEIQCVSTTDLANSLNRCRGHYGFLIGAGTSKTAGIPTSGELVKKWKKERFKREHPEAVVDKSDWDDIKEWAEEIESEVMRDNEHDYGFWFEKEHTTRGERRQFIRKLVRDKEPTFGHIILASMMKDDIIPLTLTTNFDDLLYDAFYLFLEEKPLMIGHDAIAPEFQLTRNRPTIIKLHGDYLYDNLKNTNSETEQLEDNIRKALSRSLDEYGLIVVGYGGTDESIMEVIKAEDIPDYGLFWCTLDKSGLSDGVRDLLSKPNAFLVEIEGFEQLMGELFNKIEDISVPMPHEINSRAKEREQMLIEKVADSEGQRDLELFMSAQNYSQDGEYDTAISILSDLIERIQDSDSDSNELSLDKLYDSRGLAYTRKGEYKNAYDDYTKLIESDSPEASYLNRAEVSLLNTEPNKALDDIEQAKKKGAHEYNVPAMLFLEAVANIIKDNSYEEYKNRFKEELSKPIRIYWEFETMWKRLEDIQVDQNKRDEIKELISEVQTHKTGGSSNNIPKSQMSIGNFIDSSE